MAENTTFSHQVLVISVQSILMMLRKVINAFSADRVRLLSLSWFDWVGEKESAHDFSSSFIRYFTCQLNRFGVYWCYDVFQATAHL